MKINEFIEQTLKMAQRGLRKSVEDLNPGELEWKPGPESNPVGFILWHMARAEDAMINSIARGGQPQLWETEKWHEKSGMSADANDTGLMYTAEQVASFKIPELSVLLDYQDAVRGQSLEYVRGMEPANFEEKVQFPFGPEITKGRMFTMLISEVYQHWGQIAYLRGLMRGLNK
ncbi:MAG: DinB family protein [Chloroflexota bacterium]|nr:DinB family protein [Chloroflexota bacterium]